MVKMRERSLSVRGSFFVGKRRGRDVSTYCYHDHRTLLSTVTNVVFVAFSSGGELERFRPSFLSLSLVS